MLRNEGAGLGRIEEEEDIVRKQFQKNFVNETSLFLGKEEEGQSHLVTNENKGRNWFVFFILLSLLLFEGEPRESKMLGQTGRQTDERRRTRLQTIRKHQIESR